MGKEKQKMYEDGAAVLQMKRVFLKAEKYNRKKYMTRIRSFDKEAAPGER